MWLSEASTFTITMYNWHEFGDLAILAVKKKSCFNLKAKSGRFVSWWIKKHIQYIILTSFWCNHPLRTSVICLGLFCLFVF